MMTIREAVAGWGTCTLFSTLVLTLWLETSALAEPIEIGIVDHDGDVSFQGRDLLRCCARSVWRVITKRMPRAI